MLKSPEVSKEIASKSFRLLKPGDIEEVILTHKLKKGFVDIQPLMASVVMQMIDTLQENVVRKL